MRLLSWRGARGEGAASKIGEKQILSSPGEGHTSVKLGQQGQARDDLIWGGMGGQKERHPRTWGLLDGSPGHPLTFPINFTSCDFWLIFRS